MLITKAQGLACRRAAMLLLPLLAGCDFLSAPTSWQQAPYSHTCTAEQHKKVEEETAWCKNNTDYLSTYCYSSAIMRNCTKIEKK